MVEHDSPPLNTVFHALSDGTRRHMLRSLTRGQKTVGELAQPHLMSLAAASKHIKVLEKAGLVRRTVVGRTHWCHLEPAPLISAHNELSFYEQFWTDRLDVLERLMRADAGTQNPQQKPPQPPMEAKE